MAPCPSCGRPIGPKSRRCMYCGAAVAQTAGAPPATPTATPAPAASRSAAPSLPFAAADSLDVAYRKTVAWLTSKGAPVYEPDLINAKIHSRSFGRLILIVKPESPGIVYVCVGPWDDEKTSLVATDLVGAYKSGLEMGPPPAFLILSTHPQPEPIKFLFGNSQAARIELLLRTNFTLDELAKPEEMSDLAAKVGAGFLKQITEKRADPGDAATIQTIQDLILGSRPEENPEKALPDEMYLPEMMLLTLGALFGEVLRQTVAPGQWVTNEMFAFSIALDIGNPRTGSSMTANPIGKVMKLYKNGRTDDLLFFTKILKDKLSKPPEA